MDDKELKIKEIGQYLSKLGKDPYFSEKFDNTQIVACVNSNFINDTVTAFINPPCDGKDGISYPEVANTYVLLNNGQVWCMTAFGNEYNLMDCLGESLDTVLRVIRNYYEEKFGKI